MRFVILIGSIYTQTNTHTPTHTHTHTAAEPQMFCY